MHRSVVLGAIVLTILATPAVSQGRFGSEAAQKAADRVEREAIRQAEHPQPAPPAAGAPTQDTPAGPPAKPAPAAEPAPAAAPAQ
jgi:hypothetical protein